MSAPESGRYHGGPPAQPRTGAPAGAAPQVRGYGMGCPGQTGAPGAQAPAQAGVQAGPGAPYPGAVPASAYPASWPAPRAVQAPPAAAVGRPVQMPPEKEGRRRRWLVVLIIFILACAAGAAVLFFLWQGDARTARAGTAGQLEGKTEAEIQAELDRVVDEGMFNISIANVVQFADGTSEGELRIENVPGNRYLMRVVIVLDATGEQVYETDLIEPNFHIQRDTLDADLDAGTYEATAFFYAYDMGSEEQVGTAAAKIAIIVDG